TVTATASGISTPASFSLYNTSSSPSIIAVTSHSGLRSFPTRRSSDLLVATVKDAFGNVVPNVSVTFGAPGSGASSTFPTGTTVRSDEHTSERQSRENNVCRLPHDETASVAGVSTPASFTLTNTAGSVN